MSGLGESILQEGFIKGRQEGREEGANNISLLMKKLLDADRVGDAKKASNDRAYRDKLLAEYGLV